MFSQTNPEPSNVSAYNMELEVKLSDKRMKRHRFVIVEGGMEGGVDRTLSFNQKQEANTSIPRGWGQ